MSDRCVALKVSPLAPARVRHAIADDLEGDLDETKLVDLALLVSELVTSSYLLADDPDDCHVDVRWSLDERRVRVEVRDTDLGVGRFARLPGRSPDRGHRLLTVAAVANRWGMENAEEPCIWFELDRS